MNARVKYDGNLVMVENLEEFSTSFESLVMDCESMTDKQCFWKLVQVVLNFPFYDMTEYLNEDGTVKEMVFKNLTSPNKVYEIYHRHVEKIHKCIVDHGMVPAQIKYSMKMDMAIMLVKWSKLPENHLLVVLELYALLSDSEAEREIKHIADSHNNHPPAAESAMVVAAETGNVDFEKHFGYILNLGTETEAGSVIRRETADYLFEDLCMIAKCTTLNNQWIDPESFIAQMENLKLGEGTLALNHNPRTGRKFTFKFVTRAIYDSMSKFGNNELYDVIKARVAVYIRLRFEEKYKIEVKDLSNMPSNMALYEKFISAKRY